MSLERQAARLRIRDRVQLLVEGRDEVNFFEALTRHLRLSGIQLQDCGGAERLREFLSVLVSIPGFRDVTSLGIVRDADRSHDSAYASTRDAILDAGLREPGEPGRPAVKVMILPGGGRSGMLESVLRDSLRGTDEEPCVEQFLECAEEEAGVKVKRPEKAFVHAFLATRPDPHVSAGVAAQKGYWDLNHGAFRQVREFLHTIHKAGKS